MMLRDRLRREGEFLFRWRSYLPLVLLPAALVAASEAGYLERWLGDPFEEAWEAFCILLAFAGLGIRVLTIAFVPRATSGRETRGLRADALNTTGMYSIVRNPLYLGNYLILLGLTLLPAVWWFTVLGSLCFILYYERIIYAEEAFLERQFGPAFTEWAARTPMLLPKPWLWRPPALPFSFRTVLRREYTGLYVIVGSLTVLELACDVLGEGETLALWLREDFPWVVFFVAGTVLYLTLRTLKRRTSLLSPSES